MSREIKAVAAAPGIAIAPVFHYRNAGEFIPTQGVSEARVPAECRRFDAAVGQAAGALRVVIERLAPKIRERETGIYDAQLALIQDPTLTAGVQELIRGEHVNAEVAVQRVIAKHEEIFASIDSATLRERAADIRDVGRQLLQALLRRDQASLFEHDGNIVVGVDELLPSDLVAFDTRQVRGILMAEGGKYSHGAILAKSLGIPCLVGLEANLVKIGTGVVVIVDADGGKLVVDPEDNEVAAYREHMARREEAERRVFEVRLSSAVTLDNTTIELYANVEGLRELDAVEEGMFDGIGLFRTEFAFMERLQFPSEEEQFELYSEVVEKMNGRPVTFRTLDVGGDKPLAYFKTPAERNPVLGWRGIRLTLHWQDIFFTQMRALVRASTLGPVSILLPMATTLEEVRAARAAYTQVIGDLKAEGVAFEHEPRYGIMIEVPALASIIERVLPDVDFVSVGSNDLAQYLLAVDRDNPRVAALYDPYHPGVLLALARIAKAAVAAEVPFSLCGELAGDSLAIPLLLGMGYRSISMAPVYLPRCKLRLRSVSIAACEEIWRRAASVETAEEVRAILRDAEEEGS